MVVNFKDPDYNAHASNWSGYLSAISNTDYYAYLIWNIIRADVHLSNRTTLMVVNDHGRHLDGTNDGYVGHGCSCDGCRHILGVVIGPRIKSGQVLTAACDQLDINATMAELLAVTVPATGTSIRALFH